MVGGWPCRTTLLMASRRTLSSGGHTFAVGDRAVTTTRVRKTDVEEFARVTGDANRVHSGDRPRAHGVYLAGLVSAAIGTRLPGHGAVLVSMAMRFPNACRAGDAVDVEVEVRTVRKLVGCAFRCRVGDKTVMEGTADVMMVVDGRTAVPDDDPATR